MSWQGTNWQYDPNISDIAIPIDVISVYEFNIDDVYTVFHSGDVTTDYICSPVIDIPVLGAFAYTTDITSIEIPISVTTLGDFAFYRSALQTAKVSPFLDYGEGTFPSTTTMTYWPTSNLTCVLTKTQYNVGDSFDYSTCTVTVTVYDGTDYATGNVNNYEVVDFDTSQSGIITIKIRYNGIVYTTDQTVAVNDIRLAGDIVIYSYYHSLDVQNYLLEYNRDQETNGSNLGIWASSIMDYTTPWEWCITYIPRFSGTTTVGILGTAGPDTSTTTYFGNPTIELWNGDTVWCAVTSNGSSWEWQSQSSLSESVQVGKSYSFIFGMTEEKIYLRVVRNDTGAVLATIESNTVMQQAHYSGQYPAFLCNNEDSKFKLAGDLDLSKTYYVENGILIWGTGYNRDDDTKLLDITGLSYQNYDIDDSTGQTSSSTTSRISNSTYVPIPNYTKYKYMKVESKLNNNNILNSEVFFYDSSNNYLGCKYWYPTESDIIYCPIPYGATSFKLLLSAFAGGDFTSSDLHFVDVTFAKTDYNILITRYGWTQTTGNDSTGEMDQYSSTRICCQNYLPIPSDATSVSVSAKAGNDFCKNFGYFYTDSSYITYWDWVADSTTVSLDSNATRIRVGLAKSDDSSIAPTDLTYCIVHFTPAQPQSLVNLMTLNLENTTGDGSTGDFNHDSQQNRLGCLDYIEIPQDKDYFLVDIDGYAIECDMYAWFYDDSKNYIMQLDDWCPVNEVPYRIFPNAKYIRVAFRKHDNTNISYSSLVSLYITFNTDGGTNNIDMTNLTWENHYGNNGDFNGSPANRLVCVDYVPIPQNATKLLLTWYALNTTYANYFYFYDENKNYLGVVDWVNMNSPVTIIQNSAYFRCGIKRTNDANLNASTIVSCTAHFY